jgi:LexA-binding, inner membrane-associated putative hydrolase
VPSPLGHALGGFAAGWLVSPAPLAPPRGVGPRSRAWIGPLLRTRRAWAYAAVGMAADLDLLAGMHSRYTHSLGAAVLAGAAAFWWARNGRRAALMLSLAVAASYGSHVLLDWLGQDTSPPIGIMALWPVSQGFFISPVHVFLGISRKYWLLTAWRQDATAVIREVAILAPVALAAGWCRTGRSQ